LTSCRESLQSCIKLYLGQKSPEAGERSSYPWRDISLSRFRGRDVVSLSFPSSSQLHHLFHPMTKRERERERGLFFVSTPYQRKNR
jgi:hypothetical protein